MFNPFKRNRVQRPPLPHAPSSGASSYSLEGLEDRRLLSAVGVSAAISAHAAHLHHSQHTATLKHHSGTTASTGTTTSTGTGTTSGDASTLYSAAPAAVQTGLTTLATAAGVTIDPTTQTLDVDTDSSGVTTYKAEVTNSGGTTVSLVVDSTGAPAAQSHGSCA